MTLYPEKMISLTTVSERILTLLNKPWALPKRPIINNEKVGPVTNPLIKQTLVFYWQSVSAYRGTLIFVLLLLPAVITVHNGLIPLVYSKIIDQLNGSAVTFEALKGMFLILVGLHLLGFIFWRMIGFVWAGLDYRVIRDIEQKVFNHLMLQSHAFHTQNFAGSLVAQAKRFTGAYTSLFNTLYHNVLSLLIRFIVAIGFLLFMAPQIGVILLIWTGLYVSSIIYLTKQKMHLSGQAAAADSTMTAQLADAVGNSMIVRMFGREDTEAAAYAEISQDKFLKRKKDWYFSEAIYAWQSFLMIALEGMVLYISITLVANGQFSIGDLALVQFFLAPILVSLWEIARIARSIETGLSDAAEMTAILQTQPEIKDPSSPALTQLNRGDIRFEQVDFTYGDESEKQLFTDFNLHIKPGEKIGLVGPSGSGKSTVTKLLLRFMDLSEGRILVDGQDIKEIAQQELRQHIAFVPQEPLLFHRTIMDNLRYADPNASERQVIEAAKQAKAHQFTSKLPEGYDTMVGERGTKLSGGERQRIAIARALLKNAPIVVWDEATSALDSDSEKHIQEAFWRLMENRTAIVIAHRLSTIQQMDRIIVMQDGSIAEQGTHKELLRKNGLYAQLWRHQSDRAEQQ